MSINITKGLYNSNKLVLTSNSAYPLNGRCSLIQTEYGPDYIVWEMKVKSKSEGDMYRLCHKD